MNKAEVVVDGVRFGEGPVWCPDHTLVVTWKRPYIEADGLFSYNAGALPMPGHLLGQAWTDDKASLLNPNYWTEDYVGLGAFKVRENPSRLSW